MNAPHPAPHRNARLAGLMALLAAALFMAGGARAIPHSGRDTTLQGAQLVGDTVLMDVGGNLLIESLQDTSQYKSQQSSTGVSVSLCIPPICYGQVVQSATITSASQKIKHNYRSAVGQSGIAAGDGGFNIAVAGDTHLIGAAITSQAAEENNSLSTRSLTSEDLTNTQSTEGSSESFALTVSSGGKARDGTLISAPSLTTQLARNATANLLGNLDQDAILDRALPQDGDANATSQTLSVISPAKITITGTGDEAIDRQSQETVALLTSRDPETANQPLENALTLQQAQLLEEKIQKAKENQQAGKIVGEVLSGIVGDIAAANQWGDDSPMKIALHGLAGAIAAQVGDGNAAAGMLAGVGQELLTKEISEFIKNSGYDFDKINVNDPDITEEERQARIAEYNRMKADYDSLMSLGATLVGAATGAIVGDIQGAATGATTAYNVETFNRQLHPVEAAFIKSKVAEYAKEHGISPEQAEQELTRGGLYANDEDWQEMYGRYTPEEIEAYKAASNYLKSAALLEGLTFTNAEGQAQAGFTSTPEQFKDERYLMAEALLDKDTRDLYVKNAAITLEGVAKLRFAGEAAYGFGTGLVNGAQDALKGYASLLDPETYSQLSSAVLKLLEDPQGTLTKLAQGVAGGVRDEALNIYLDYLQKDSGELGERAGKIAGQSLVDFAITATGISIAKKVEDISGELAAIVRRADSKLGANSVANAAKGGVGGIREVEQAATGIQWGKGIQGQGMPYENYVASLLPADTRLPANFKTFDFFDKTTGVATSVKTLDTTTAAKVANPNQVYFSLKNNVDAMVNFESATLLGITLDASKITARHLDVAIPASTISAQWAEINRAIQYGQSRGVTVMITVVK